MNIKNTLLISLLSAGAIGLVAKTTLRDHQVKAPYLVHDVTGDGIEDIVTIRKFSNSNYGQFAVYDGQLLRKGLDGELYTDENGNYYARGGPTPLHLKKISNPPTSKHRRSIVLTDDGISGLDLQVIDYKTMGKEKVVQSFNNIFLSGQSK